MPYHLIAVRMSSLNLSLVRGLSWSQVPDLFRFAARRLNEERLPQVAGSLTFTTVLAVVPVLTIAFAIFTTFPLFNTFRTSLEAYFIQSLMPRAIANTILGYLSQFAAQATRLSAVGAVALIGTAVAMIAMVDRTFNQIWRVRTVRPFAQRIIVYWAIVTLGPLLIGVSITVTSYLFTATNGVVRQVPLFGTVFYTMISVLLTAGTFTLLYVAVPNRLVDWHDAACGGMLAAIAFEISKRLFAIFVAKFPTYTVVYGALAAVPIFLVWIYLGWLITLTGAVLTAALPVVKYERWWHVAAPGSAFVDAIALLEVLFDARAFTGSSAVDVTMLRAKTRLGFDESEKLLQKMLDAGWVGRIKAESPKRAQFGKRITEGLDRWTLLANPDHLTLADVYRLFVFDASGNAALARQVERAVEQGLSQTLAVHFVKNA
ncbi:MAG: putative ribonuclease [Herminiimonas sp.]|nr:putative ribonuclease [Herminiimonas sp.]